MRPFLLSVMFEKLNKNCEYHIKAIILAFQARDVGSIPTIRLNREFFLTVDCKSIDIYMWGGCQMVQLHKLPPKLIFFLNKNGEI